MKREVRKPDNARQAMVHVHAGLHGDKETRQRSKFKITFQFNFSYTRNPLHLHNKITPDTRLSLRLPMKLSSPLDRRAEP